MYRTRTSKKAQAIVADFTLRRTKPDRRSLSAGPTRRRCRHPGSVFGVGAELPRPRGSEREVRAKIRSVLQNQNKTKKETRDISVAAPRQINALTLAVRAAN